MVEIRLQSINDVAGLGMFVPEHAQVSNADGGHEWADHLVELACRGSQDPPERRVSHVEEGFYRGFN
jgi:hypothetical protein